VRSAYAEVGSARCSGSELSSPQGVARVRNGGHVELNLLVQLRFAFGCKLVNRHGGRARYQR